VKGQGKLNTQIIFESILMVAYLPKIIKLSSCLSKRQLAKVGAFLRHSDTHVTEHQTMIDAARKPRLPDITFIHSSLHVCVSPNDNLRTIADQRVQEVRLPITGRG